MRVGLRVDADERIGYGHLVRTEALGKKLARDGAAECRILTRSALSEVAFPRIEIADSLPPEKEGDFIGNQSWVPEILVADLYRPDSAQIRSLREASRFLVCVDDETDVLFDCDLLVNPSLSPEFTHRFTPGTRYLHGAEVVLLRDGFDSSERRPVRERLRRMLICFGGSDPQDLSGGAVRWLHDRLPSSVEQVALVLGTGYRHLAQLRSRLAEDRVWKVVHREPDMAAAMRRADVGLVAGGTLAYEAVATGLPSVLVSVNRAQAREAELLQEQGAAIHLPQRQWTAAKLLASLALLAPVGTRRQIRARSRHLIDGYGTHRVARRILRLAAGKELREPPGGGLST